jgi:hypothetical protein
VLKAPKNIIETVHCMIKRAARPHQQRAAFKQTKLPPVKYLSAAKSLKSSVSAYPAAPHLINN